MRAQRIVGRYGWRTPFVVLVVAFQRWIRLRERFRLLYLTCCTRGPKGRRVQWGRDLWVTPGGFISIGDDAFIGDRCAFEIGLEPAGQILIGASSWISRDGHLQSTGQIQIGQNVLIGEFVSIRDTTHGYQDIGLPIKEQPDVSGSVVIEDGVWIGRGCLIQAKPPTVLTIGRGAIVGANSVVTRSIPAMEIWAGAPARLIKSRRPVVS